MAEMTDDEKLDLAHRTVGRLAEPERKSLARRVLLILFRRGQISEARLRKAGIDPETVDRLDD